MNLGFPEMMFIFILALILFGPKKLPEIGKQIGKGLAEFKRASREFQSQIEDEVRKLEVEVDLKNTIAPPALYETVAAKPPALTVGTPPEILPPSEEIHSASSAEIAAAAAAPEPDHALATSAPKADSAGNA
jgi:sec-independent protein translocase protein TatB